MVGAGSRQRGYQKAGWVRRQVATVRVVKTVQVINRETHLGKCSEMSDGAKQDFAMREMKSKAYKACLTECSCVISANE